MNQHLSKIDCLIQKYMDYLTLQKLNQKQLKFFTRPCIAQVLQNSIKKKNNRYSKFVKCKDQKLKEFYHNNYMTYRNLLSTLLKKGKEKYFTKFFNKSMKDIKKTWIVIEFLVSMKRKLNDTM